MAVNPFLKKAIERAIEADSEREAQPSEYSLHWMGRLLELENEDEDNHVAKPCAKCAQCSCKNTTKR